MLVLNLEASLHVISRRLEPEDFGTLLTDRCMLPLPHAFLHVLVREQTTRLNESWNDFGRP